MEEEYFKSFPKIDEFKQLNPVRDFPESAYINIIGARRTGKTILAEYILAEFQKSKRKFDKIFLISPTGDKNFMGIPPNHKFPNLDILNYIMETQRKIKEYNSQIKSKYKERHIKSRICVVIDDMAYSGAIHGSKIIDELALNGRHISNPIDREGNCLMVMVLSQQVSKISPAQRRNNDYIIFNSIASSLEVEQILQECFFTLNTSRKGKGLARQLYHDLSNSKDYRFLAVGNCIQNKRTYPQFIFVVDAKLSKPKKLFGNKGDWDDDDYFPKPKINKNKNLISFK